MSIEKLDLNRLEIFRAVALNKSFSKAALQLKQPKSRVSRNITALEKEMGVQLIYRTTRQFKLTEAGQSLFNRCLPLLSELRNTLEFVQQNKTQVQGLIKLTVPEDIGTELMGEVATEFLQRHPLVELNIFSSNDQLDLLAESFDMAIRIGHIRDSSMIQKSIGVMQMGFFTSPEYLLEHPIDSGFKSLEKMKHLAFRPQGAKNKFLKVTKGSTSRTLKTKPIFISNNFFILRTMAAQSMGVTQLPLFMAQKLVQENKLVQVFKEWTQDPVPIRILIPQQKEVPVRIQRLMGFLSQKISSHL